MREFRHTLTLPNVDPLLAEEEAFTLVAALADTRIPALTSARRVVVERAKAFLAEHAHEPVSLGEVARAARTSPFSLARVFPTRPGRRFINTSSR